MLHIASSPIKDGTSSHELWLISKQPFSCKFQTGNKLKIVKNSHNTGNNNIIIIFVFRLSKDFYNSNVFRSFLWNYDYFLYFLSVIASQQLKDAMFCLLCMVPLVVAVFQIIFWKFYPLKMPKRDQDPSKILEWCLVIHGISLVDIFKTTI